MVKILLQIIILTISIIALNFKANCSDVFDEERHKYIRNMKFNDSFLDIFFRTSPGLLPINSIFIDENLIYRHDASMNLSPISRTRLTRRIDFSFEGVPIYDFFTGEINLSSYSFLSNFFYLDVETADSLTFPSIGDVYNIKSDTNRRRSNANINIAAGNQTGAFSGHFFTTQKHFKYFISGSYLNSPGMPVPSESIDEYVTATEILKNSDFSIGSVFGKFHFDNGNSQAGLTSFFSKGNRSIPLATNAKDSMSFLRVPDTYETLINFEYSTLLEKFLRVSGNIFYKNTYYKLSSYDDTTFLRQNSDRAYNNITFGYNYGGKTSLTVDWGTISPTTFGVSYIRDILNKRKNDNLTTNRYEVENLFVYARQSIKFYKFTSYLTTNYAIKKPLFSDIAEINNQQTAFNYKFDVFYSINQKFKLTAHHSSEHKMPSMQEIFYQAHTTDKLFKPIRPELETNSSFGFLGINSDFELAGKLYYSEIDDIIVSNKYTDDYYFLNQGDASCWGADFNFKVFADYGYILINYTYTDFIRKPTFSTKPKHLGEIKIYNIYSIGIRWLIEAEYFSGNVYLKNNTYNQVSKNIILLNFRLAGKVLLNSEMFLGIYNIFDTYYESEYGVPGAGISFLLGVSVNI